MTDRVHQEITSDSRITTVSATAAPDEGRPRIGKEVNNDMSISDWLDYFRQNWRKEDGQTMAEYGVVLAVITLGVVVALTQLSGGISGAITNVISKL